MAADPAPDGDEAREWAERELAKPAYLEAEPTVLDRIARAIGEFVTGLFSSEVPSGWGGPAAAVVGLVVAALIVTAFVVWGRPRRSPRSARPMLDLFGADERRSAAALRREAARHAAAGEWGEAIVLRFRALARSLGERGIVDPAPGATVHAFARNAARAFPAASVTLDAAATAFDDVRYLRRPGTEALYRVVADADDGLAAARPVPVPVPVPV